MSQLQSNPAYNPQMVTIRPMQIDDLEAVHAIDQLSFSTPWPLNSFRFELLENEHSLLRVAEYAPPGLAAQVLGGLVIWLILDEAHIATLSVHPDYRRQGLARLLLASGLLAATQRETDQATLEVRAGNLAAQALYRGFGFQVVGRRKQYYRDNQEDALLMTVVYREAPGGIRAYRAWLREICQDQAACLETAE